MGDWIQRLYGILSRRQRTLAILSAGVLVSPILNGGIGHFHHANRLSHALDNVSPTENFSCGFSYCPGSLKCWPNHCQHDADELIRFVTAIAQVK
jgi:hypothetical protein